MSSFGFRFQDSNLTIHPAGAMIFVCVEELIPESRRENNTDFAALGAIFGFALMMMLDVALG